MIGSRIHTRYPEQTITVKAKTITGGQNVESNALTGLIARRYPMGPSSRASTGGNNEIVTEAGMVVIATDVFWFEPVSGSLPAITENHVLVDSSGVRYEVVTRPTDQAGGGNRLKVVTRRLST